MKILITGANGQLGKDVQKECEKRAIEYIPTDFIRTSTSILAEKKLQWKPLDITDFE